MLKGFFKRLRQGITGDDPPPSPETFDHDRLYHEGSALLYPYIGMGDDPTKQVESQSDRDQVQNGIILLQQVTTVNTGNWPAHWLLGQAYAALDDAVLAYTQLRKAHEINPGNRAVLADLAIQELNLGRVDDAYGHARAGIDGNPTEPIFHVLLAAIYLAQDKQDKAADAIAHAKGLDTRDNRARRLIREFEAEMA